MAIQILPHKTNHGSILGNAIGQALQSGIEKGSEREFELRNVERQQNRQKSRLEKAFQGLNPNEESFVEQFKQIAPALLTTPGGAQALSELSPLFKGISQANATANAVKNRRGEGGNASGQVENQPNENIGNFQQQPNAKSSIQNKYLNPTANAPEEQSNFPQRTANYSPQPDMSQKDIENLALDLLEKSSSSGVPISYNEARQTAQGEAEIINNSNERIRQQQQQQQEAQSKLNEAMVIKATNNGLIKSPEDETIVKKFANEARDLGPEVNQWEYVRDRMRLFDKAKGSLTRGYTQPTLVGKYYRKLNGTYKDKEQAIKDMQPSLNELRELGLYDEARNILTNDVGLGPEDAELALFPFGKEELNQINDFPKNNISEPKYQSYLNKNFAGDANKLNIDEFRKFKQKLGNFIEKNPDTNLIGLRGKLNQEKRYYWQDIYQALDQLVEERDFKPNAQQKGQLEVIKNAPIPGLDQAFHFFLNEKK